MTYGWAILLFFLTIGTLAYSGVFSPTSFLPEECNLPGGLICEDYIIGEGEAKFIVRNGLSDRITITAFKVLDFEGGSLCSSSGDTNISRGGIGTIVTICDTDNQLKQKLILQVDFYLNDALDLSHRVSGTVRSEIKGITIFGEITTFGDIPKVWMFHFNNDQLLDGNWDFVKNNLDVIEFPINVVGVNHSKEIPAERLQQLFQIIPEDVAISVQAGGLLNWVEGDENKGEASAAIEIKNFERFADLGGTPDIITLDDPIRRSLYPNEGKTPLTVEQAADELVDYMHTVRAKFPDVQFVLLVNFPNWGWKGEPAYLLRTDDGGITRYDWGDYFEVLTTVFAKTQGTDVSFTGITVDNPYEYAIGEHVQGEATAHHTGDEDWIARIMDLENYVESQGLAFNLIINSARGGKTSDKLFQEETLAYLDIYRARGGSPAAYLVESWYPNPQAVVAETTLYSMTNTVREVISSVKGIIISPINNYAPTGIFGPFNTNFVSSGWAVDNDTPLQSIDVEMVLYSPLGERDVIATITANSSSNPGFPYPGDHRFSFTLPESLRTGVNIIHTYAIDAQTGERKELTGSPQMTGNVSLQLAGEPETVYNWTIDRCRQEDIPDLPTRVFRDAQGNLQLFSSFYMWYRESGPNFDNLTRNCNPVFTSHNNSDPSQYDDYEWLSATYRTSGNNIYALIHEEYHGEDFGNCPSGNQYMCLRMSITQGMSTDGGNTFQHAPAPQHLVASAPYQYDSAGGPFGYMVPSNIIKHADGNYYAFFNIQGGGTLGEGELKDGVCLARTASLENPSWRAWNGSEFSVRFINPYLELNVDSKDYVCEPIRFGSGSIAPLYSVLFNKNISKYVMSTIRAGISGGKTVTGVYYAFSNDIIHWTAPQLLWEVPRPAQNLPPGVEGILYGTLIDHNSSSINFETMGSEAYFYYKVRHMRSSQDKLYDRDLMRRRVIINYS